MVGPVVVLGGFRQGLSHHAGDRQTSAFGDLLGQPGDMQALLADDVALFGLQLAADQPQERALPLAVAAQQADPFPTLDLPIHLIQETGTSEREADAPQAEQCHERFSPSCDRRGSGIDSDDLRRTFWASFSG